MTERIRPSECNVSDALQRMADADSTQAWRGRMHTFLRDLHAFTQAVPPSALTDDEFVFVNGLIGEVQDAMQDEATGGAA
jgi:hypothetical protein